MGRWFHVSMRAALAAMISVSASLTSAQTVEAPRWKVGDKWVYEESARFREGTTKWFREVAEAKADGTFAVATGGRQLTFDRETNSLDNRGADYSWRRFAFPMSVGKSWSWERKYEGQGYQGREQGSFRVVAYEKLTVPAGTFDCMKVEGTAYRNWDSALSVAKGWNNAITKTTYWYCPEVGWVGKWIVENQPYSSAAWGRQESVLTSFAHAN